MLKIAVMGPESTGKSSVSAFLAAYYKTVWVPEYARAYCADLDHDPDLEDEQKMLEGQLALEDQMLPLAEKLIFCDTMYLTVKIWSEYEFNTYPEGVNDALKNREYDFFLVMNIDLPWQEDPLRNFPHLREHFMQVHLEEVASTGKPYTIISGLNHDREMNAVYAVDAFLKQWQ